MANERVQRRLTAVLAADVVGYSRLSEADEAGTRARFRALQLELLDPLIEADGGRIVKTMGDGILVEFPSVVDAVHSALAIQDAIQHRNKPVPEKIKMNLRIGVNTGDVIIEGKDIHGDGVNVAARLEDLCKPGEIYVSGTVYDQSEGKLDAKFEDMGEHSVKNITKPVRVYRVINQVYRKINPEIYNEKEKLFLIDKPTIAVLPFDNMSNDPEQEYFSDGMSEDLITDMSKISGISVAARNSSFSFKGQPIDVKDIARKLGVNYVVEGSVRKMGNRVRINAQLINGVDGHHIWAERYDGNMEEIFDFQDDIRKKITETLQIKLTRSDKALADQKMTESVEAYEIFLKGRSCLYKFTKDNIVNSVKYFEESISLDPNFSIAYSFLSRSYFYGYVLMIDGFDKDLNKCLTYSEKAFEIGENAPTVLIQYTVVNTWMRKYEKAKEVLYMALSLAPDNAEVYATGGQTFTWHGEPEIGIEMIEKAIRMDVFPLPTWDIYLGISCFLLRRYGEAVVYLGRSSLSKEFIYNNVFLSCAHIEMENFDEAQKDLENVLSVCPSFSIEDADRILPLRKEEDRNRVIDALRKAGFPEKSLLQKPIQ